jgi:hypothetical protein
VLSHLSLPTNISDISVNCGTNKMYVFNSRVTALGGLGLEKKQMRPIIHWFYVTVYNEWKIQNLNNKKYTQRLLWYIFREIQFWYSTFHWCDAENYNTGHNKCKHISCFTYETYNCEYYIFLQRKGHNQLLIMSTWKKYSMEWVIPMNITL